MKTGDVLKFKKSVAEAINSFFKQRNANIATIQNLGEANVRLEQEAWDTIAEIYPDTKDFLVSWNSEENTCVIMREKKDWEKKAL